MVTAAHQRNVVTNTLRSSNTRPCGRSFSPGKKGASQPALATGILQHGRLRQRSTQEMLLPGGSIEPTMPLVRMSRLLSVDYSVAIC